MGTAHSPSYKKLKEEFVSNLSGGPTSEIAHIISIAPTAVFLWSVLQSHRSFFKTPTALSLLVDFLINVCPVLLAITISSSTPLLLSGLIITLSIVTYGLPQKSPKKNRTVQPSLVGNEKDAGIRERLGNRSSGMDVIPLKPFLTQYRGSMLLVTCLGILAVDFQVFPRRFAKVETWGTSLTDLGVGSFVFSGGVVAARPILKERATGKAAPLHKRLLYSMRHALPLFVLGIIRTLSVKGLHYAEHVTEYGVHWNFFFTLGLLPPFVAVLRSVSKMVPSYAAFAILLGVLHQVVLKSTSLEEYILLVPRTNIISMNREGLCSFVGYLAIFLAGQDTGMYMLPRHRDRHSTSTPRTHRSLLLLTIAVWSGIWAVLYYFTTDPIYGAGLVVSRRLANLPYILWIIAFNSTQILAYCLIESLFFPSVINDPDAKTEKEACNIASSRILRSFNQNGLALFLIANLLTGLVNMTINTLDVGPVAAIWILLGYAIILASIAIALDTWSIPGGRR
jgi:phosphatidylinositol glycan class W